ncbi:MAG TPA: hypothetical protein VIF60_08540 [Burkholderiaceae bacterium]|jgi:hypothetical protein
MSIIEKQENKSGLGEHQKAIEQRHERYEFAGASQAAVCIPAVAPGLTGATIELTNIIKPKPIHP